jgi:hypothetical protein
MDPWFGVVRWARVIIDVPCSHCGARLSADGSTPTPLCAFCGTHNTLPASVWQQLRPAPPPIQPMQPMQPAMPAPSTTSPIIVPIIIGVVVAGGVVIGVLATVAGGARSPTSTPSAFATPSAPCNGAEAACSTDGKSMLECDGNKLVVALTCKGPKGCRALDHGKTVSCDYTRADENDPCNVKDSACSTDGKSEVRCDGAKFVTVQACGGPDGCTVAPAKDDGYTLTCDAHVAPLDAPCLEDGRFACSSDMKSLLRCTRGHFILASACKGPCTLKKDRVADTTTVSCERKQ